MSAVTQYLSFCVWLVSLSIMCSRFICVVACISFLFKAAWHPIVWIYHLLFSHSFVDGRLGCFHVWAIVDNAAVKMCVQIPLEFCLVIFFFGEEDWLWANIYCQSSSVLYVRCHHSMAWWAVGRSTPRFQTCESWAAEVEHRNLTLSHWADLCLVLILICSLRYLCTRSTRKHTLERLK